MVPSRSNSQALLPSSPEPHVVSLSFPALLRLHFPSSPVVLCSPSACHTLGLVHSFQQHRHLPVRPLSWALHTILTIQVCATSSQEALNDSSTGVLLSHLRKGSACLLFHGDKHSSLPCICRRHTPCGRCSSGSENSVPFEHGFAACVPLCMQVMHRARANGGPLQFPFIFYLANYTMLISWLLNINKAQC